MATWSKKWFPAREYVRLGRRGLRRSGAGRVISVVSTLWLGKDHLLSMDTVGGCKEEYRRFYYKDIQAIIVRRTRRWLVQAVVTGGLVLALGTGLALLRKTEPEIASALGIPLTVLAIFFIANALMGPTCVCRLRTAVQTEELPSLNRTGRARKAIRKIRERIEQAQGALPPEDLRSRLTAFQDEAVQASPPSARPALRFEYGAWHQWLFMVFFLDAAYDAIRYFVAHVAVDLCGIALAPALLFLALFALLRQRDSLMPQALKSLTVGILAYLVTSFVVSYFYTLITMIGGGTESNSWAMFKQFAERTPEQSAFLRWALRISFITSLLFGIVGLALLGKYRQENLPPTPRNSGQAVSPPSNSL